MKKENRLRIFAQSFEQLPGIPLVEICGQRRVLIENHCGIAAYGCNEILINVSYGQIRIYGNHLKITKLGREKLVVCGHIDSVNLLRSD